MNIYRTFAQLYATGDYPQYSARIATILPKVMSWLEVTPHTLLDLACGEGTFVVTMAKQGLVVTGLDQSPEMIALAKEKAEEEGVQATFIRGDMRRLEFSSSFDFVTCWFDSLNYLLELEDLVITFQGVANALTEKGFFIFDLNTIYWLVTLAQRYPCTVERETEEIFQVHRHSYNFETNIGTFHITGFIKENDRWLRRVDETHKERGYTLEEVRHTIKKAGLQEVACWENLENQTPHTPQSRRVFFITQKI
ncbi:MAG: class I SAM-dependent DNA methyltransferase [Candidatus Hodarchaeota archaeon]